MAKVVIVPNTARIRGLRYFLAENGVHLLYSQMHLVQIAITFHCLQLKLLAVFGSLCHEEKRSQRGFALVNATYISKEIERYPDCLFLCVNDARCMSFNFWWDKKRCDLNSKAKDESCEGCFLKEASSTYMEMLRNQGSPGKKNK